MPSQTAPGVKIDKQTTLRLTSKTKYIEEDVSSLISSDKPRKSKGGILLRKKLQWRSNNNNHTDQGKMNVLPPSTSPLSRKLGAPAPGINNIVVQGRGDCDNGTVASGWTRTSAGTTVSCKTRKHSNRRFGRTINSEASVSSSVNSRLPPIARLRKRIPVIHENSSIIEEQNGGAENDDRVVLGSSITISKISNQTNEYDATSDIIYSEPKLADGKSGVCSPTSVLEQDDRFCSESRPDYSAGINSFNQTPTSKRFVKKGVTLSTSKNGKMSEIERVESNESSSFSNSNITGDYRNAMDKMRKLMTGGAEDRNTETERSTKKIGSNNTSSLDASSVFADLELSENSPNTIGEYEREDGNSLIHKTRQPGSIDVDICTHREYEQEDDNSLIHTTRQPGPIDVDTCTRHITPLERRNLRAMHKLGYHYLRHNEINQALDVFMEILRGQKERHGKKSLEVAMAMHNLGVICVKGGKFEEGTRLCDGAARIRVEKLGADHLDVAVSLAQQGVALMEIQQYHLALASFREALRIRRKALGFKHPLAIRLLNNIGCALFELNSLSQAEEVFGEALAVQRELMKDNSCSGKAIGIDGLLEDVHENNALEKRNLEVDPKGAYNMLLSIALTQCNLGSIHLRWGKYDESLFFYEDALLIQESVLGEDHQVVLHTKESIDFVIKSKEENHQALLENRASITTFPSILNVDHLTSLIRPRYEEMVALLDSVVLPNNDSDSRQEDHLDANVEHDAEGDYDSLKAFGCGQPLLCADEEEME